MNVMRFFRAICVSFAAVALTFAWAANGGEMIRALIINGQNNHDWAQTSPIFQATLESTGLFQVDTSTSPGKGADAAAWAAWNPAFGEYDVVISDYNGQPWPELVRREFVRFVEGGGGVVIVHAANNAFPGWPEYDRMIGLGWRNNQYGDRIVVDPDTGAAIRMPPGEGPGAGHGRQHPFTVTVRAPDHPIMRGIPPRWMHGKDELYHGQRGPASDMTILSSAFSDPKTGGTGAHEPITWFVPFGQGKVVTTVMGHHGRGQRDFDAVQCVGFQTILVRAAEWAAKGTVSYAVPANFPGPDRTRIGPPEAVATAVPRGYRLQYAQDFSSPAAREDFVFTDPAAWRWGNGEGEGDGDDQVDGEGQSGGFLEQFQASKYKYEVRSPFNIALMRRAKFGSFVMDCELRQTGKEYGHRDMCVFFNLQDRSNFYYSHIATKTDDHAHNIFIVNDRPRTKISTRTTAGHDWSRHDWHRVRVHRDLASGEIAIYVNDLDEPIMRASDTTFGAGYLGFGTFDDTGKVRRIRVYAPDTETEEVDPGDLFEDGRE